MKCFSVQTTIWNMDIIHTPEYRLLLTIKRKTYFFYEHEFQLPFCFEVYDNHFLQRPGCDRPVDFFADSFELAKKRSHTLCNWCNAHLFYLNSNELTHDPMWCMYQSAIQCFFFSYKLSEYIATHIGSPIIQIIHCFFWIVCLNKFIFDKYNVWNIQSKCWFFFESICSNTRKKLKRFLNWRHTVRL